MNTCFVLFVKNVRRVPGGSCRVNGRGSTRQGPPGFSFPARLFFADGSDFAEHAVLFLPESEIRRLNEANETA